MAHIDTNYHKLLQTIINEGFNYEDPNRKGVIRRQIHKYDFNHDFKDGFPAITTKKLFWKGVVGELLWFLRGDTNIKYLVDNGINIWNKDAANWYNKKHNLKKPISVENLINHIKIGATNDGDLGRVYGAQFRSFTKTKTNSSIDQISNLIKGLKKTPMSTEHIVTAWNPAELNQMALPPCHNFFQVLPRPLSLQETIEYFGSRSAEMKEIPKYGFVLSFNMRSVDTFLGLPFNIASYSLLAYIIGKLTDMKPLGINGTLKNVHIYEPHLDQVKLQLSRDVNKYNNCTMQGKITDYIKLADNIDEIFEQMKIEDFILENYNSFSSIKAPMLAYNK